MGCGSSTAKAGKLEPLPPEVFKDLEDSLLCTALSGDGYDDVIISRFYNDFMVFWVPTLKLLGYGRNAMQG